MAEPMILEVLSNLKSRVATNETNIAKNSSTITANKKLFDTHTADDNRHWTTTDRQNFDRVVHFKGYYTTIAKLKEAYPTGQLGDYAIVGGTDTVWLWDDETNSWLNSTEQGIVISVNGRTGEVILTKTDVGLSNVDNTSDKNKPISTAAQTALDKKADRGLITAAQADSNTLRSGMYYLNEDYTILGDTTMYWSIIHCESLKKTGHGIDGTSIASQIWINFQTNGSGKIYYRRQQFDYDAGQSGWSEFKELATNIDISNLQTQITTNTNNIATNTTDITTNKTNIATNKTNIEANKKNIATNTTDISKLKINKANRGDITLDQANTLTSLQSGIYSLPNVTVTLGGDKYTNNWFTVIVCDWADGSIRRQGTQIWIPFSSGATTTAYIRHQKLDTDGKTRVWGDFIKIANQSQINNLQSQINTNKTNIANLDDNKADRKKITVEQSNSHTLRAGIYELQDINITILDEVSNNWTIIVGDHLEREESTIQIWMPFVYGNDKIPKMFLRRALSATAWTSFVEIYTTNYMSKDDISRFKQYKGYFADLVALRTAHSTAKAGDYAIAGTSLYVWDNNKTLWTEISGGGSTGSGKWSIKQYNAPLDLIASGIPYIKDLIGLTFEAQWEIDDNAILLNQEKVDNKIFLIETWVNVNANFEWTQTYRCDDGCSIYLNGEVIASKNVSSRDNNVAVQFKKGWNKFQILLREKGGSEVFEFASKLTTETQCLGIDCYHSENALTEGYVPLVGNSTIEGNLKTTGTMTVGSNATVNGTLTTTGNITSGGTVGITSNAYLKYNTDEKSISFIFN